MTEISLIGPDGSEVHAFFQENDHKTPTVLYSGEQVAHNLNREGISVQWSAKDSASHCYAFDPAAAYRWLRDQGWKAVAEEEDWLQTGQWPD